MWTKLFWKDTAERVLSTAAQALVAILTTAGFTAVDADPVVILTTVGVAAAVALLKAIVAGAAVPNSVSPASLVKDTGW